MYTFDLIYPSLLFFGVVIELVDHYAEEFGADKFKWNYMCAISTIA